jgi:hypothetical protein
VTAPGQLDKCKTLTAYPYHYTAAERGKARRGTPASAVSAAGFENLKKTWTKLAQKAAEGKASNHHIYSARKSRYMKQPPKRHPRVVLRETVAKEAREIQDMARKFASAAMNRAFSVLADPTAADTAVLQAADLILNRAYGKPNQTNTNLNVDANGKISEVSGAELNKRIAEALKRVEDITGRERQAPARKKQPADLRKLDRDPHGPGEPVH